MNEVNSPFLNPVKNRFLPLPASAVQELEHEPNISDFNIIKEIGSGTFAKVFLASHKKTKVKYAIKAIDKLNLENEMEKTSFNREVEIMYKLDHPNIVKLYSHFEDNQYCYLIMQYIPNGSAYDLLPKNGKKPNFELISSVIRDIIRAIYYLHNMFPPIIHRDIKPENILLDENYNAYLTDFGWSNYIINKRRRNSICGTPLYYPPEMLNDLGHDEKADIWCIGILLVELTTGNIPFKGDDEYTVKVNISDLNISWPNNIDPDIKELCSKILIANSSQRPDIEHIYENKFFKKYLKAENLDKKLIKPKKLKNKVFIVNKDIPNENINDSNNTLNDSNSNKKSVKFETHTKNDIIILNTPKGNNQSDPKTSITKKINNRENNKSINIKTENIEIKKQLANSLYNGSNEKYKNKSPYNGYKRKENKPKLDYYQRMLNSSKNLKFSDIDSFVNNKRGNNLNVYNSKQTEENKSNNYISIGTNYTNKLANSNSINKNMNHTKRINTNRHIVSSKNLNLFSGNFGAQTKTKELNKRIIPLRSEKNLYTYTDSNENRNDLNDRYNALRKDIINTKIGINNGYRNVNNRYTNDNKKANQVQKYKEEIQSRKDKEAHSGSKVINRYDKNFN